MSQLTVEQATEIMKKAVDPTGFTILVEMLDIKRSCTYMGREIDYTTGTIVGSSITVPKELYEKEKGYEETGQIYARVVKMGPDCYTRMNFKPKEAWCKPGDLVRLAQYGGENVKTPNFTKTNLRLINDNDVIATVNEKLLQKEGLLESVKVDLSKE